jgi:iron complex outermembrane receptor protein
MEKHLNMSNPISLAFAFVSKAHLIHLAVCLVALLLFFPGSRFVLAQEDAPTPPPERYELDEEIRYMKAEMFVITPSRIPDKIKKTASSITVITDKQIRQMGAKDLGDVLHRAVPGVVVGASLEGPRVTFVRGGGGFKTVLLMINSHPVTRIYAGDWSATYGDLIIENIKRIEVIRGPGSALYGANAFHGVINVITKEADDIDGLELIARGGIYHPATLTKQMPM